MYLLLFPPSVSDLFHFATCGYEFSLIPPPIQSGSTRNAKTMPRLFCTKPGEVGGEPHSASRVEVEYIVRSFFPRDSGISGSSISWLLTSLDTALPHYLLLFSASLPYTGRQASATSSRFEPLVPNSKHFHFITFNVTQPSQCNVKNPTTVRTSRATLPLPPLRGRRTGRMATPPMLTLRSWPSTSPSRFVSAFALAQHHSQSLTSCYFS